MSFDLRLPVGMMFTLFGLILAGVGFFGGPELTEKSLGINMNLWWGLFMLLFGLVMLVTALRANARKP
jgi:hypothetical protein